MKVTPSAVGTKSWIAFEYRLHFRKDGSVYWQGTHPFYGYKFPPLEVPYEKGE